MTSLTIKDMYILAKKHNGRCLSKHYKNNRTKLIWRCKNGHTWRTTPAVVKSGSWCKKCSFDYDKMNFCRKYSFNENILDDLNKQESAYILGLFCADGYISNRNKIKKYKCSISLQEKDKEILDEVVKIFDVNPYPLKYRPKLKQWSLTLSCKHLWDRFNELGCTTCKTFTFKFPTLPKDATRHFFRGYIDGDGCICIRKRKNSFYYKVDFISSNSFCFQSQLYLKKELNIDARVYQPSNISNRVKCLLIERVGDVEKFLDWIYQDSRIHLQRKYEKYLQIKKNRLKFCVEKYKIVARNKKIVELYQNNSNLNKIKENIRISKSQIYRILRKEVKNGTIQFKKESYDHSRIIRLLNSGKSQKSIAKTLGCDPSLVSYVVKKNQQKNIV